MIRAPFASLFVCRIGGMITLAAILLAISVTLSAAAEPRPNVLFLVADDLNNDLGCYGNTTVKTTNIDRLAERGVRFDRAYCQYPLCNPSRTSFLSGQYPTATRVWDNDTSPRSRLGSTVEFLPEYFERHGYFTARVGKVAHETFEREVAWNVSERSKDGPGYQHGQVEYDPIDHGSYWEPTPNADEIEQDGRTALRVAELIDEHRSGPFFIAAGFKKPHRPWPAPAKYFDLYPWTKINLAAEPAGFRERVPLVAVLGFRKGGHVDPEPVRADQTRKQIVAAYYATISFVDAQIGHIFDRLDRHELWDDTIVVFLSDHGYHLGDHGGLWHKMSLFEEAARVPLLVAAPGKAAGKAAAGIVEAVDLYPTLVELCGLPPKGDIDGQSFAPLLADPAAPGKTAAFTMLVRTGDAPVLEGRAVLGRSIRTEDYRYTEWSDGHGAEMYDHREPGPQFVNLADDPRFASERAALRAKLDAFAAEDLATAK